MLHQDGCNFATRPTFDISGSASWQKLALILRCRQRCLMTTWQTLQCLGPVGSTNHASKRMANTGQGLSDPTNYDGDLPERFLVPPWNWSSKEWSLGLFVSIATVDARQHANSCILLRMECSSHMFTIYCSDLEACGDVPYMDGIPSWRWMVVKKWELWLGNFRWPLKPL